MARRSLLGVRNTVAELKCLVDPKRRESLKPNKTTPFDSLRKERSVETERREYFRSDSESYSNPKLAVKFKIQYAGEWVYPRRKNYYMKCCGCGLVHRMNFKLEKTPNGGHKIKFQAFRVRKRSK